MKLEFEYSIELVKMRSGIKNQAFIKSDTIFSIKIFKKRNRITIWLRIFEDFYSKI